MFLFIYAQYLDDHWYVCMLIEMSRLIIKNLPKALEKDKLAELFAAYGDLTDVRICKKRSGESRRFGFVGFKNEEDAAKALNYFNKSYINTSKVEVGFAKNIGDPTVPRPWSKYSSKSSEFERNLKEKAERKERIKNLQEANSPEKTKSSKKEDKKKRGGNKASKPDSDGVGFDEFVEAHQKPSVKKTWTNELVDSEQPEHENKKRNSSRFSEKREESDISKVKTAPLKATLSMKIFSYFLILINN